jgi:hypothetical protein
MQVNQCARVSERARARVREGGARVREGAGGQGQGCRRESARVEGEGMGGVLKGECYDYALNDP